MDDAMNASKSKKMQWLHTRDFNLYCSFRRKEVEVFWQMMIETNVLVVLARKLSKCLGADEEAQQYADEDKAQCLC